MHVPETFLCAQAMRELWRRHWFWKGALVLSGAGREVHDSGRRKAGSAENLQGLNGRDSAVELKAGAQANAA